MHNDRLALGVIDAGVSYDISPRQADMDKQEEGGWAGENVSLVSVFRSVLNSSMRLKKTVSAGPSIGAGMFRASGPRRVVEPGVRQEKGEITTQTENTWRFASSSINNTNAFTASDDPVSSR